MQTSIKETIQQRRSVRTYKDESLHKEDARAIEDYLATLENPFGIPVEFRLLDSKEHGLSSPVIVGANTYVAAKVAKVTHCEIAYGYSFEKFCLYAATNGMGTVMLAGTLNRAAFERAMDVRPDEVMPVASPVGYPAEKIAMREGLMRKGVKADERKAFDSIFFSKDFNHGLAKEDAGDFADALEAVRWAPSAGNKQPWRVVVDGTNVHFFEAKSMKMNPSGDIQKVDIGIALAHFDVVLEESGIRGVFTFVDPGIPTPDSTEYIVTFELRA